MWRIKATMTDGIVTVTVECLDQYSNMTDDTILKALRANMDSLSGYIDDSKQVIPNCGSLTIDREWIDCED